MTEPAKEYQIRTTEAKDSSLITEQMPYEEESAQKETLSMATDSCPNFHIDGVAYDYRPVSDWNNSGFYKYFNEIPWKYE